MAKIDRNNRNNRSDAARPTGSSRHEWQEQILTVRPAQAGERSTEVTIEAMEEAGWELQYVYPVMLPSPAIGGQTFVTNVYGLFRREKG